MLSGREFQIAGAEYANERLPLADFKFGRTRRFFSPERRDLIGACRRSSSDKYEG